MSKQPALSPLVVKPPRKPNGDEYQKGRCGLSGRTARLGDGQAAKAVVEFFEPPEEPIAMSLRLTIMELTSTTCRWPLGDPCSETFRYCGIGCEVETPYCVHHSRMAYAPAPRRGRAAA